MWGNNDTTNPILVPVQVSALKEIEFVEVNFYGRFTALDAYGNLYQWVNDPDSVFMVGSFPMLADTIELKCGNAYCLAIMSDNTLWGWGNNGKGQIGTGDLANRSEPVRVQICINPAGEVITVDEYNTCGGLGGALRDFPDNVTDINAGYYNSFALAGGEVYAWSDRGTGIIGDGTQGGQRFPKVLDINPE
jgi:alpha-tubulin suppressor-like RCC1 family protein